MPFVTPSGAAASCASPILAKQARTRHSQRVRPGRPTTAGGPEIGTELTGILEPVRPAQA